MTVKSYDAKQQKTKTALLASVAAMLRVADIALEQKVDKKIITATTDSVALALQCHHDLNTLRRFHMKKELHDDDAALCNASTPASDELFGDLTKQTKDIQEANKVAKKVRRDRSNLSYPTTHQRYANERCYTPYKSRGGRDFQWGLGKPRSNENSTTTRSQTCNAFNKNKNGKHRFR